MLMQDKELSRQQFSLGKVRSASFKPIIIPANSKTILNGYVDNLVACRSTCALLQPTKGSIIPEDIDIVPTIVDHSCSDNIFVDVHVTNSTTRTISISSRALLCDLQAVNIEDIPGKASNSVTACDSILNMMNLSEAEVTQEQMKKGKHIISEFLNIFSTGEDDIGHTTTVKHGIELKDEQPFKQRHRRIPPAMYQEVKDHLQHLLTNGIIRKSYSPWSSNIVLAPKKDGTPRMCVDYRYLSEKTIKDAYALPRIEEMFDALAGSKY